MKTLNTKAKVDNLDEVISFIDAELEKAGCNMKTQMQINIAVEELFVNVSNYAYNQGIGDISISIAVHADPEMAEIILSDSGIPYDPLSKEDPDVGLPAEKREIGGLGIFMVKKTMDMMTYERRDGKNVVTITKYL